MIKPYHNSPSIFDEVFDNHGEIRPHYQALAKHFNVYDAKSFSKLHDDAKLIFYNEGVTFAVYSNKNEATERIFPFDMVPRLITSNEWKEVNDGVLQRNKAINDFLKDIYGEQKILKDGVVPRSLIDSSENFVEEMRNINPTADIYNHINGSDIIRHSDGGFYILEDNVRCPSGVSYVIANRQTLKKTFPSLFSNYRTRQVNDYSSHLLQMLQSVTPNENADPCCVVLTPGAYNSAYYEHSWLAQSMGIELVEGRDMFVKNDFVYTKTIYGPRQVDVIYRRIDDDFIDPEVFNSDSLLGVPGLMKAYAKGNVTLVNAPGTGVADDKAVYTFMPQIIEYYLSEKAILKNVPTYKCENDEDFEYVMDNIDMLVVKPVDESGGYGITIGTTLSSAEIGVVQKNIAANRRKYIAQPIMSLSTHPTFMPESGAMEGRHLDLRTFCLLGKDVQHVVPGGLTRVALKKGNLIVNSSQGGGSKDTWVID